MYIYLLKTRVHECVHFVILGLSLLKVYVHV